MEKHPDLFALFDKKGMSYEEFKEKLTIIVANAKNMDGSAFPGYKGEELTLDENAPQELKDKLFFKKLTLEDITNPENAKYLEGKKLSFMLKNPVIRLPNNKIVMLYDYLEEKYGREKTMEFISKMQGTVDASFDGTILSLEDESLEGIYRCLGDNYAKELVYNYHKEIKDAPLEFKRLNSHIFLPEDAPPELKEAVRTRKCSYEYLQQHPEFKEYVKNIHPALLSPSFYDDKGYSMITPKQGKEFHAGGLGEFMLQYGHYVEKLYQNGMFFFSTGDNIASVESRIESSLVLAIKDNKIKYNVDLPKRIRDNHPELFLPKDAPEELARAFYDKTIDAEMLLDNPELLKYFDGVDISLGFERFSWIRSIYDKNLSSYENNYKMLQVIKRISKIEDAILSDELKKYVLDNKEDLDYEKLDDVIEIFKNILVSNSSELYNLRGMIARELVKSENPVDRYKQMEKIFVQNNLPTVGKVFLCFKILHPEYQGFNLGEKSKVSPVLLSKQNRRRDAIIFGDLLKCTLGSNNRNLMEYLDNISKGSALFERLYSGEITTEQLSEDDLKELRNFSNKLEMLYKKSFVGQQSGPFERSGDPVVDIAVLKKKLSPDGSMDYKLEDRVVQMYFGLSNTGMTCDEVRSYMKTKVKTAVERSTRVSNEGKLEIRKGDLIKGIVDIRYLGSILQNGSVAKEYLGSAADSDATPLDTDVSMIERDGDKLSVQMGNAAANSYGPIFLILKNDDRFCTTRDGDKQDADSYDPDKLELFQTGVLGEGHYGIRTGFASTEIDAIYVSNNDPLLIEKVKLEIAKTGFYIPIVNDQKQVVFTVQDYEKMRSNMQGMSHYDEKGFRCSPLLVIDETKEIADQIIQNNQQTRKKGDKINGLIREVIQDLGYDLKTTDIDGDLSEGVVELIDTGSTGRGTNAIGDGDYDYMVRLDRKLISNPEKLKEFKDALRARLLPIADKEESYETDNGDFRYKKVRLDEDTTVDLDLSFTVKTDKISYSTDMALKDRLQSIKEQSEEQYTYVVANILLAKKVLKEGGVYKPDRGDHPEGGLGGVGVENWILQNGGSFLEASVRFLRDSEGKTFEQFKKEQQLWDFGENHMAAGKGRYPHDNFYSCNMSKEGYLKMKRTLSKFLVKHQMLTEEKQAEIEKAVSLEEQSMSEGKSR